MLWDYEGNSFEFKRTFSDYSEKRVKETLIWKKRIQLSVRLGFLYKQIILLPPLTFVTSIAMHTLHYPTFRSARMFLCLYPNSADKFWCKTEAKEGSIMIKFIICNIARNMKRSRAWRYRYLARNQSRILDEACARRRFTLRMMRKLGILSLNKTWR